MARKAQPDGVIGTLQRLFGHDDDRSLLTKLAGTLPLKRYVLEPGSNVFKRSVHCDNLIKNMLALDTVFNSQEFVYKLANGEAKPAEISEKIQAAKARLEKKMQAYAYWVDRIDSLEEVLTSATGFEEFALEDRLSIDVRGRSLDTGSPYALRAVRLLEQVEERGRGSLLNADQLNEKAWALYRLGVHEQAVGLAQQAVEIEPTHAEAWLLQALHSLTQKRSADRERALYEFEREQAEPLSGHEYWADEMRDAAEDRMAAALERHRHVVFQALKNWPVAEDGGTKRYRDQYEEVRASCIDWLFALTAPNTRYLSTGPDWMRASEDFGRSPIPSWQEDSEGHYVRWMGERGSPSGLSDLEIEVAKAIAAEWDAVAQKHPFSPEIYFYSMGNGISPSRDYQLLKLLHVCSVLKLQGYGAMREHVLRCISESISDERLSTMIHQPWLLQALILHGSADGVAGLEQLLISMTQKVVEAEQAHVVWLKANVFRKLYHLAFAKADFTCCLRVARDGHRLVADFSGAAPNEVGLGEMQSNLLTCKHWKYLELRAAIEIAIESDAARQSLLSVEAPATYFSDEHDYCIREVIDFDFGDECYVTPYGHSIIKGGDWMKMLSAMLEAEGGFSSQQEIEVAHRIMAELGPLMEDLSDQENAFAAWSLSDFE